MYKMKNEEIIGLLDKITEYLDEALGDIQLIETEMSQSGKMIEGITDIHKYIGNAMILSIAISKEISDYEEEQYE